MQARIKPQPSFVQLFDLTLIQLSNVRWVWRSMLITGTLAPCMSTVALGIFAQSSGTETLAYIFGGNIVLALMFENLHSVCSNFSYMKTMGTLNYFATLPIQRSLLILSTVLSFMLLSLPAVIAVLILGSYFLKIGLQFHPLAFLAVPLAILSVSAIGAFIGTTARSPQQANSFSTLFTFLLLGMGPVIIPPQRLPGWLVALGWISPSSYAASAIRQVFLGPVTDRLALDLGFLAFFSLAAFWIVDRRMDWRQ